MLRLPVISLVVVVFLFSIGCGNASERPDATRIRRIQSVMARIKPLHKPMGKARPGDWLLAHPERGQTFAQYLKCRPVTPTGKRRVIYVQPLGEFTKKQRQIVTLTADYMGRYFNRPVKIRQDVPLSVIPDKARRKHPSWGMDQILTTYVLEDVLHPKLPGDAAAYIAFTASDLWPGEGWNFVFGQASLRFRVGVWSIYRNGDLEAGEDQFRLCLLRTIKTATHETGHMFSMRHCIAYECNMCGSNHRAESDRRPAYLCPECVAKLLWATGADPAERYSNLAEFCKKHGLKDEETYYRKAIEALKKK